MMIALPELRCALLLFLPLLSLSLAMNTVASKSVLLVGGTRFSGLYLWRELHKRGHRVTLFNRGKTEIKKIPSETDAEFIDRKANARYILGDRQDIADMSSKLSKEKFDVVYDMGGRDVVDTAPLVEMFNGKIEHFIYMSSAGVYKKSPVMPHHEGDEEDTNSRHKGKLETEAYLRSSGIPFTSIRPTYIYGPMNYKPLEEYFFLRLQHGRRICIPGHGQHLTGLGHVEDLATAMAQVIGREHTKGKVYNVQDEQSVTFESLAALCCVAAGKDPKSELGLKYYDPKMFDFEGQKAFPMREQHFFCSVDQAKVDLEWTPQYDMLSGLKSSYEEDFKPKLKAGLFENADFGVDGKILDDDRVAVKMFSGLPRDDVPDSDEQTSELDYFSRYKSEVLESEQ